MLTTRDSLIRNLYSALDHDPDAVVALRVGHPSGLSWKVADGAIEVFAGGSALAAFQLSGSLLQLRDSLLSAGVVIKYANPDLLHLSAGALLEGEGSEAVSNGDQLRIFTSTLWAFMDAYAVELDGAERQIIEAVAQLYIDTADGEMLDLWGEYFGVTRLSAETDDEYRVRIIVETLRPKSNRYALEMAASAVAGDRIEIYEPWTDLFHLSDSKLDAQRTFDGDQWSPYVFRPIYNGNHNIRWDRVLAVLERLRPAGVLMLPPEWKPAARGGAGLSGPSIGMGYALSSGSSHAAKYADRMNLDDYHLGDPVTFNYRIVKFELFGKTNTDGIQGLTTRMAAVKNYVRAGIVLSDMDEGLGHERVRFPGAFEVSYATQFLDDFRLSDFDTQIVKLAPEDVHYPLHAMGAKQPEPGKGWARHDFRAWWSRLDPSFTLSGQLFLSETTPIGSAIGCYSVVTALLNEEVENGAACGLPVIGDWMFGNQMDVGYSGSLLGWNTVATGLEHGDVGAGVAVDAVSVFGLEAAPTYRRESIGWVGGWSGVTWRESFSTSGVLINVTTESI